MSTLNLVKELRQDCKYEQALIELQNAEMNSELYLQKGLILYELSRFEEAIDAYSESLNLDSKNFKAYNNRGNAKGSLKLYTEAINDYDKAISLNPNYSEAYFNRGFVYYNLKKYKEAISDYNKAIELDPENFMAYNNRGNAKHFLKDYSDAISDFDKSLEIQSTHNTFFNRALAKESLEDYDGAISDYSMALDLKPDDIQVLLKRGFAEYQASQLDLAKNDFLNVLSFDKNNVEALVSLGMVYHLEKNDEKAVELYSKAISINDEYADAYINRSISSSFLKKYDIAEADLRRMFSFDIFRNDYLSTFVQIRDVVASCDDDASKKFLEILDKLSLDIKK